MNDFAYARSRRGFWVSACWLIELWILPWYKDDGLNILAQSAEVSGV